MEEVVRGYMYVHTASVAILRQKRQIKEDRGEADTALSGLINQHLTCLPHSYYMR